MPFKRKMILQLIGAIGIIAIAVVHLVIGKYYSISIPPLAFAFLGFGLMWLITGIVCLQRTLIDLEMLSDTQKKNDKGKR